MGYPATIHSSSWNIIVMVNDVFVLLSWVTHLSIKQIDCTFSYIIMHVEVELGGFQDAKT